MKRDARLERGQLANLTVMRAASEPAKPGPSALGAALEASGRFMLGVRGDRGMRILWVQWEWRRHDRAEPRWRMCGR